MNVGKSLQLCNNHSQDKQSFSNFQKFPCVALYFSCTHPEPLAATELLSGPIVLPFPERYIHGTIYICMYVEIH